MRRSLFRFPEMASGKCGFTAIVLLFVLLPSGTHPVLAASAIDRLSREISEAVERGRNAEGLAAAQKLEAIVRKREGTGTMNHAGALHNQGMFLHNLGRYQEAANQLSAALEIKLRNTDVASTLRTSGMLAPTLLLLGRRSDALAIGQRALALGIQAYGPDDERLSSTLESLGAAARDDENYGDAEQYFQRALTVLQKSSKPSVEDIASAMDSLGEVYGLQGRFDDGARMLQQAMALLHDHKAGYNPDYAKLLNDLGNLYKDAGRLPEAEAIFRRALGPDRGNLSEQHPNFAATMGNLASVLNALSRFREAETLQYRSLLIYEKVFGPNHQVTSIALNNLANSYTAQGRIADAVGLQQRVLAIYEKLGTPDSSDTARALVNLGNSYARLGRSDEAGTMYRRALAIMETRFGPDGAPLNKLLGALGNFERNADRLDDARHYFERALAIDERVLGERHPTLVNDLRSIALLDTQVGNYSKARATFERALGIAEEKLSPGHRVTQATLVNLAAVAGKQGKWPEALVLLRRASDGNAQRVNLPHTPAIVAPERFSDLDRALIAALWHVGNGAPGQAETDDAFKAAQRAFETKAGMALAQMAVRFGAGNDAIAAVVRRQQDLRASLGELDTRIVNQLGAPEGKRNDALIAGLRMEAAKAQAADVEMSSQIARDFPGYAELSSPQPLSVAEVQALLKDDEALVFFSSSSDESFVFAVTREQSTWRRIALSAAQISDRVTNIRASLVSADPNVPPAPFDLAVMLQFYNELFGPVDAIVATRPKLLVIPTGALTSLPFQVLVTKPTDPKLPQQDRAKRAAWLINDKAITILPAVTSLRALRNFARASRASRPFIGFGNPSVGRDAGNRETVRSLAPYSSYYSGSVVDYEALRRSLTPLPDSADELRAVARVLGAGDADLRLGPAASLPNVMNASLRNYRVIQFATHGLVAGDIDGLSEPALLLSLPDRPTADDDGLLTAGRIATLKLDADWAILSACNTAAGDRPGAEGLSGLARAFFYAGARSLLVSHWPVESDAAVKLTTRAFAEITSDPSIGRAEAVRRSMLALISDSSSPRNSDPSVWAPFVLVGEGN